MAISPKIPLSVALILMSVAFAYALPVDFYASTSKLAAGRWAKVEVTEPGMQFISNATLRNLGFQDPEKVNVYGYGGRMLAERLDSSVPDDLPAIPSIRTAEGIVFFGHSTLNWESNSAKHPVYKHTINPYSEKSFYFLGETDSGRRSPEAYPRNENAKGDIITVFTERLAHEKDLLAPTNTGRTLLGEDFRTQNTRSFEFKLPGNTGDATATICFGAYSSGGQSSLMISANGKQLPSSKSDIIPNISSDRTLFTSTTTIKTVENPGDKLSLSIQFSNTGALKIAALDYIEVEYTRELKLHNNELYFYINPDSPASVEVEGCGETTLIWDVTDPSNPLNVEYKLNGTAASFTSPNGYHEFVAFNPSKISRAVIAAGKINNQNIHGMEIPDMVIISPDVYKSAAQRVADLHAETDGLKAVVLSPEEVYNEFSSGTPDLTAFRKLLKMWYDRGMNADGIYTRHCLLFARPSYDNKMATTTVKNAGYPRLPIWQSSGSTKNSSYSTDDYIGMLDDQSGNLNKSSAKIHVAVGRMPVKSTAEANAAVEKLEKYFKNPNLGAWRNNVMLIADDQDDGKHLSQAEDVYKAMRSKGNGADFIYEKLYLDAYTLSYGGTGPIYPEAKQRMMDKFAEGVSYVNYIGHANPTGWGHESLLTWTDIISMSNTNLPFIYAATCEFLRWDDDAVSGGEEMWLNPYAGVIGMICPSREVFISQNGILNERTAKYIYSRDDNGNALTVGDIMRYGKNDYPNDDNKLRYGLIGDPAMRILSPSLHVSVDSIGGIPIAESDSIPVIPARGTFPVSGRITDFAGNFCNDFNGCVEIQIYDAEKVVVTKGNGKDGRVDTYNDRKTRLYSGKTKVSAGVWSTVVTMPSEIENNYSPALISLYAYDDAGREANGASENIYVYGYDENASADEEGPTINEFHLNSPEFTDGASVSPSPIVMASFSDASGINISDSGIGHKMSISLDDNHFFNDVNLYYSPDENDHLAGSIAYPLKDIEPGKHSLTFTVWDNANNSSSETLTFNVSASWKPEISQLTTDVNPASSSVNFIVSTDGANGNMECKIEVFDLGGKLIWTGNTPSMSALGTTVNLRWDLCDFNGTRVARGIYPYRATVTTQEGAIISKTCKLAVTAQ